MDQAPIMTMMSNLFAQGRRRRVRVHHRYLSLRLPNKTALCTLFLAGLVFAHNTLAQSSWPRFRFDAGLNGRAAVSGPLLPELQWKVPIGSEKIESPVVAADSSIIFISRGDEYVYALRPNGSLKWRFSQARQGGNGNEQFSAPPVIGKEGNIYVGTQQGSFLSLDENGNLRWRAPVGGWVSYAANVDDAGKIYVAVDDAQLYVFNPNGNLECKGSFDGEKPGNTPAIAPNGRIYAPAGNSIYVFDSSCQRLAKWQHAALGEVAWAVVSPDGNTVYAGSRALAAVVALHASSGSEAWVYHYDQVFGPPSQPAIGPQGTIYFAGFDRGLLQALTPDGNPQAGWPLDLGSARYKTMPVVDARGNLFIVNERADFGLLALAPDKQILWRLPEVQCEYSIAFGPNGTLYIPSLQKIYAVRQKPGRIVARPNPVDFGAVCLNTEAVLQDTLVNEGSTELIISSYALSSPVFKFEAQEARLQPGESLVIALSFTPNAPGSFQDTLLVSSNDPDHATFEIVLRGQGLAPHLTAPANLTFPATEVGFTRVDTLVVRAEGACALRVDSVSIQGLHASDFSLVILDPLGVLPVGDSLRVQVTFAPQAVGERSAELLIASNDPDNGLLRVPVRGTGTTPLPHWQVSPGQISLAACVDTAAREYLRVENTGLVNVVVNAPVISSPAFVLDTTALAFPFTLLPRQSLFLPVRFTPSDTATATGTLTLTSGNAQPASFVVSLTGKSGQPQIALAARPAQLEVCRGQSAQTRIVVFNTSTTCTLRIDSFKVAIAFSQQTLLNASSLLPQAAATPIFIAPGDSTVIPIEVTQPPQDFELRVTFWSNAAGSPHLIAVPGKVLSPAIAAVDTVEFGVVPLQQTSNNLAALWNAGRCELRIISARLTGADSAAFTVDANSLPVTLPGGDTLGLPVTFSPTRPGDYFALLLVANDDPDANPVRMVLHGEGRQVEVFPRPPQVVFRGVCLGSDSTQVVEIVNNGSVDAVAATLGFLAGRPEFSFEPTTDFLVPAGQTRQLVIGFKPQMLARVTDTLRIVWQNPNVPPVFIAVEGEAVSGQIAAPVEHVFPSTLVQHTEIDTIYVRNFGACDLAVDSVIIVKDLRAQAGSAVILAAELPFKVLGGFTGTTILPGDSLGVPVAFTPPEPGLFVASLQVYNNDPDAQDNPAAVRLLGSSIPMPPKSPDIAVAPDSVKFEMACTKTTSTFEISNAGDTTLTVTAFVFSSPAYSTMQPVPFALAPLARKTVSVTYDPALAQHAAADTLFIFSNDPDENPYAVELIGNPAQPNIAGASRLLFPETEMGRFSDRAYSFSNSGACSLRVAGFSFAGLHFADFEVVAPPPTPFVLAAGDSIRLTVRFTPRDSLLRTATLNIASNDPDENPKIVQLQGVGRAPSISIGPYPLDFGQVRVGRDSCAFVTIENRSHDSLSVTTAALRKGEAFKVEGQGLDLLILPGQRASLEVCFVPLAPGSYSDTLDVPIAKIENGRTGPDSLYSVALRGEGVVAALYAQSPINLETQLVGRTFTVVAPGGVKNIGKAPLTIFTLNQPAANFTVELLPRLPLRLEPGESKDVRITFQPSRVGDLRSSFVIISDAFRDTVHVVELMGRGFVELIADLKVSPENLDFGRLYIKKDSTTREFHIINNGPLDLKNVTARLDNTSEYEIISPVFPLPELKSQDSVAVMVKFKPMVSGQRQNEVQVASGQTPASRTVELSGTGKGRPDRGVRVKPEVFTPNHDGYNDFVDFEFPDIEEVFEPVIKIFNLRGQLVATLEGSAVTKSITWSGEDSDRRLVPPHTYLWILQDGNKVLGSGHVGVVR